MYNALDVCVEDAWKELKTASDSKIAEYIFRSLTEFDKDGQLIRRPVRVGYLYEVLGGDDIGEIIRVINIFRSASRNFLSPFLPNLITEDTVIDISHESLIRQWRRLKGWMIQEEVATIKEKAISIDKIKIENISSINLRNGTLQDIQHICSSMEQLFLSYKSGDVPFIYVVNLLELLFQSARTRIVLLRKPSSFKENGDLLSVVDLDGLVVFTTFRKAEMYKLFLTRLVSKINKYGVNFLDVENDRLGDGSDFFYICLPRVYPENASVLIDRSRNKEAYYRLSTLLRLLEDESKVWGRNVLAELYACFSNIPNKRNIIIKKDLLDNNQYIENKNSDVGLYVNSDNFLLKTIEDWAGSIYGKKYDTPLLQVTHPKYSDEIIDYRNLFFFARIDEVKKIDEYSQGDFNVKLIIPHQQRRELSHFYHKYREHDCQWYMDSGCCRIGGMGKCCLYNYWQTLPKTITNENVILTHYAVLWEQLSAISNSSYSKSRSAFNSGSILFDRRQEFSCSHEYNSDCLDRDRISACITSRMISPKTQDNNSALEYEPPQIMYVPIYASESPFVLVATVVNAQLPKPFSNMLSEWRRSYRFADMVSKFMSGSLDDEVKKTYLNELRRIVKSGYETYLLGKNFSMELVKDFLTFTNTAFDSLARSYPYHKIILSEAVGVKLLVVSD